MLITLLSYKTVQQLCVYPRNVHTNSNNCDHHAAINDLKQFVIGHALVLVQSKI